MADEIKSFLTSVNPTFGKYADKLSEQGLTSTEELSYMQDDDFKHIGVPLFHWRKIVAEAKKQFGSNEEEPPPSAASASAAATSALSTNHMTPHQDDNEMNEWGADEVALFIRTLSNGEHAAYAPSFVSNGVDGAKFLALSTVKELAQIVPDLGARYAIWEALQECKVQSDFQLISPPIFPSNFPSNFPIEIWRHLISAHFLGTKLVINYIANLRHFESLQNTVYSKTKLIWIRTVFLIEIVLGILDDSWCDVVYWLIGGLGLKLFQWFESIARSVSL